MRYARNFETKNVKKAANVRVREMAELSSVPPEQCAYVHRPSFYVHLVCAPGLVSRLL